MKKILSALIISSVCFSVLAQSQVTQESTARTFQLGEVKTPGNYSKRTLISADSKYDKSLIGTYKPSAQEMRGIALLANNPVPEKMIRGANCEHCHGGVKRSRNCFTTIVWIPFSATMEERTSPAKRKTKVDFVS